MIQTKKQIIFFFTLTATLFSDLASPNPFIVTQPNGFKIEIINRGNHLQGWHEYNGWTILKNSHNWWVYANGNKGRQLQPSNIRVGIDPEPNNLVIKKGIRPEKLSFIDDAPVPNLNSSRNDTFYVPLILVEFPDAPASYDSSDFELLMNQTGYSHLNYDNTGSFKDFFQEISYNQFLPISEVTNWLMAPENHNHYSYNNPNGYDHVRDLVRYLVDELEDQGFDWSKFDNDGDGYVDALNIVHQGAGAEQGDYSNIWSHKSSLGNQSVSYDGVIVNSYTMNPEIQSGNIVAIGVLAHEFGHALGLPDLYDTDYSSTGAGLFSLMASGAWGTTGNSPWYPSTMIGWCKNELGWVEIVNIEESQNEVQIEQSYSNNQIIRVNHPTVADEYWLIENRQKIGSDTLMPAAGLAIWHINDNIATGWAINNNEPYYGVGLEQADGLFGLENGGPSNAADIYPGITDNREFSHSSSPNTTSLYGDPSMVRIDNISDPGANMSFNVTYNEIILATATIDNGSGYAYDEGTISLSMDNEMEIGSLEFELDFYPAFVAITGVTATERTSFDSVMIENNVVTLYNPLISAGSGTILNIQLFNNVGVETEVLVTYDMCIAYTTEGQEIGINILDEATYEIQPSIQYFNIQNGSGTINGGASCVISLINTVPISMTVFQIIPNPNLLSPSEEPYDDLNNNNEYDLGEPFTDWNENNVWSPIIEPIDLNENWNFELTISESFLTVGITNWNEALEIGPHDLFRINYSVNTEAELNDIITLNTNALLILDAWGNNGVSYLDGTGNITIDNILSNSNLNPIPEEFSLKRIHPNPFNAQTLIHFTVPKYNKENVIIKAYDLNGRFIKTILNKQLNAGNHEFIWNVNEFSSGIYFIEFNAGKNHQVKKVTLLK